VWGGWLASRFPHPWSADFISKSLLASAGEFVVLL
jgi:hypothetical protein